MQTSLNLNEKSRVVCIKVTSFAFIAWITEHTTAKCPICEKTAKAVEYMEEVRLVFLLPFIEIKLSLFTDSVNYHPRACFRGSKILQKGGPEH